MTTWQPSSGLAGRLVVHHVALDEVQVRVPVECANWMRVAMQVVVDDDFVVIDQRWTR